MKRGRGHRIQDLPAHLQAHVRAQLAEDRDAKDMARIVRGDPPRPQAVQRPRQTKLEQRYQAYLETEERAGRVLRWTFEPMRLLLRHGGQGQKGLTYCPDFAVQAQDCLICDGRGFNYTYCVDGTKKAQDVPCAGCGGTLVSRVETRAELHEVKPVKKDGTPLWLGDSRTKVLAAAELFSGWWRFVLVTPEGSGWKRTVL